MAGLRFIQEGDCVDYTPDSAVTAGIPVRMSDGRCGIPLRDIAASELGALKVSGIFEGTATSGDTWNKGDTLVYDASADKLVKKSLTLDGATDIVVGPAQAAKTSGQTTARAHLNEGPQNQGLIMQSVVYEFDSHGGADTDERTLIPAELNPHGLLLLGAYGIVTEVFAGTQDQGIVTIEDSADGAICTLTPSDGGADVVGDVIVGTSDVFGASTGDAAKFVPAGAAVQGFVSQETTGSAAGKMKVYLLFMPLL